MSPKVCPVLYTFTYLAHLKLTLADLKTAFSFDYIKLIWNTKEYKN